jgi:general secretion pathway protein G
MPYQYQSPVNNNQGFALYSFGADSVAGGEGFDADIGYLPVN